MTRKTAQSQDDQASSVAIEDSLLASLDRAAAVRKFETRDALVNAVLSEYLGRFERAADEATYARMVLVDHLDGDTSGGEPNTVYELALRELGAATKPTKRVYFRRHTKGTDGSYFDTHVISFPIGGAAWVRETLLPWIEERLEVTEATHRNEVAENRRKGQQRRANRTLEQKATDDETRRIYTAQYGAERWSYASSQANRHRLRAERRGLTEHFTVAEWINRAALSDFLCEECGADEPLETHHIRPLSTGGSNRMDNVQLLCNTCHVVIGMRGEDGSGEWFAQELERAARFTVGDQVRRVVVFSHSVRTTDRGVVLEIIPPTKGDGPLWCRRMPSSARDERAGQLIMPRELLWTNQWPNGYQPAKARVLWTRRKGGKQYEEEERLTGLEAV